MPLINRRIKLIFFAVLIGAAAVFFVASIAKMQGSVINPADIQFPVKELGNCQSETDCKSYCDKPGNIETCVSFAEKHNLMSSQEVEEAKKFIAAGGKGPGGCTSKDSCENYCNDANNISECIAFAEKTGIIPPSELEEAKKVKAALENGANLPGGCKNKKECDAYCGGSEHMEECIAFAEAAGFIPPEELADARKALEAIKKGAKPLPCRGKTECDAYCSEPGNFESCIAFAEAAGFVSSEEAVMARKTGGKGPGDCRGREECEAFCKNPDNQEICFNFGKEHGLIPESDLREMEEGKQKMKEGLLNAPPEVLECLTGAFGNEFIEKLKNGTILPSRDMGDKMRGCFEKMGPPSGMPPQGEGVPAGEVPSGERRMMPGGPPSGGMPPEGEMIPPPKEMMPPEGFSPPKGPSEGEQLPPEQFKQEYEKQYQERFQQQPQGQNQQQFQEQYRQQFQQQYQQYQSPGGGTLTPPPAGEAAPPPTTVPISPPPPQTTQPQTLLPYSPFGAILNFFLGH